MDVLARAHDFLAVGFSEPPAPVPRSGSLIGKAKLRPAAGAGSGWRLLFWLMARLLRFAPAGSCYQQATNLGMCKRIGLCWHAEDIRILGSGPDNRHK